MELCERKLKLWALEGLCMCTRTDHREAWSGIEALSAEDLPDDLTLDSRIPEQWPTAAASSSHDAPSQPKKRQRRNA